MKVNKNKWKTSGSFRWDRVVKTQLEFHGSLETSKRLVVVFNMVGIAIAKYPVKFMRECRSL